MAQRDEYLDSLRRTQADFQNFKRRNQTARADGYEDGVREAIAAMLPSIDNLERALDAADKAGVNDGLTDGVRMTLNTLLDGLKRFGFEEVPSLGEQFDPELHNAVMRESGDEPGKILELNKNGLVIACGEGAVEIRSLQAEGGKRMAAPDYFRGHPLDI